MNRSKCRLHYGLVWAQRANCIIHIRGAPTAGAILQGYMPTRRPLPSMDRCGVEGGRSYDHYECLWWRWCGLSLPLLQRLVYRERKCAVIIGSLAQCRFPGLVISYAKILLYFSYKIYGSNSIEQHSETVMVWNYQNADCSLRKKILCHLL